MNEQCIVDFMELGFTRLEAEVYVYLVINGPATGYKIAKALGRPNTNIYRALATLRSKGASLVADGSSQVVRAVDPTELLEQLNRRFREKHERAADQLAGLQNDETDDRTYLLTTVDQVYGRARRMLAECRELAFLDVFPLAAAALKPDIEETARRGVVVAVQAYEPTEIEGAEVVLQHRRTETQAAWPIQALVVVVDGTQSLLGVLDSQGVRVHYGSWTASIFQSIVLLGYAQSEMTLSHLMPGILRGDSGETLQHARDDWRTRFSLKNAPAYSILQDRFADYSAKEGEET